MGYYLEIWLRGFAKDHLRKISTRNEESYHPHITFARPFEIATSEEDVKHKIVTFCEGKFPISFSLEGKGAFEDNINYVPIVNKVELLEFNNGLEQLLESKVRFNTKLNDAKILHATIDVSEGITPCLRIDQYMLRLTGIKDKRIWFSYDFVTQEVLDRDKSLDKSRWYQTVHKFSELSRLLSTRTGYQKIGL